MTRIRVVGLGVLVAALWAAAAVAWVDVWPALAGGPAPAAAPRYAPPTVLVDADVTGVNQAEVAAVVEQVVNDPRGWHTNFDRTTLRIVQPGYRGTDGIGALIGQAWVDERLAVVTSDAWTRLSPRFADVGGTLDEQRTWVVLHELGHLLGYEHTDCPAPGEPAPLMRPVDYELGGCTLNVWVNS